MKYVVFRGEVCMWRILGLETTVRKGMHVVYVEFKEHGQERYACGVYWVQRQRRGEVCMLSILGSETKERRGMHEEYIGFRGLGEERYACGVCWVLGRAMHCREF